MIPAKFSCRFGPGRFPSFSGAARRLAVSARQTGALRRQHLFYHAVRTASAHNQTSVPNHESRRPYFKGI